MWIIRPVDLARFASAKQLLPLPEAYTASNGPYQWDKLLPLYGEKLTVWERIKYAMPLLGEAPLCFYRSDLFNAADHQNAYQTLHGRKLAAPATWQEFEAIVSFFKGRAGLAQATLAPLPATDEELLRETLATMDRYSTLAAQQMRAEGRRPIPFFDTVLRPALSFIGRYIFLLGFLDGREGFLLHLYHAIYVSWKYAKAWELARNRET